MPLVRHVGKVINNYQEEVRLKKEYQHYKYSWIIKDFHRCYNSCGQCHESPRFWTGGHYEWTLDMFVAGYSESISEYVAIRAYLMNADNHDLDDMKFIVECSILDSRDEEQSTATTLLTKQTLNTDEGVFKQFILKNELLDDSDLLLNNELRIVCRISFEAPGKSELCIETRSSSEKIQLNILNKLLNNDEFSDFTFIIGEKEIHVHRAILAASSPVFRAMFQIKMRESNEGKVHIDDIEFEVMEKLLHFVYVGEADALEGLADKVLVAAEKYQLDSLKLLCEDVLSDALTVDNVYNALVLADKHYAIELQNNAIDFFSENLIELRTSENFETSISLLPINLQTSIICALANKF